MTPEQLDRLATSLRAGDYNLLLGAAASLGSKNKDGADLPLAEAFRLELCKLKSAKNSNSLQRIYDTLTDLEIFEHVTKRFSGCAPGLALRAIPSFIWKRVFTLNIDDALEASYTIGEPYQIPYTKNFSDTYEEIRDSANIPIIHLHGYTARPSDGYIFSREAYLKIIKTANPWMVVLSQLLASEPFIIIGSSLDEVDLDYFLSLRTPSSSRADRGPSILVEPFGDIVTDNECARRDLIRFPGTAEEFMKFLQESVIHRPRPHELISPDARSIFIGSPTTKEISSFYTDFEKVPSASSVDTHDPHFFFGHIPTWSDLSLQYDVARPAANDISRAIANKFSGSSMGRLVLLSDTVGVGKSTTLRRVGFDLARQGVIVLSCSASSRLEPRSTADMLSKIAGRCVVLVDDFADQVYSVEQILRLTDKSDLVFVGAERSYRYRFVKDVLSGIPVDILRMTTLSVSECEQLVDTYIEAGLVGSRAFVERRSDAVLSLKGEPIAVACCRILNDLKPLDRIVESVLSDTTKIERHRYITAALAQFCIKTGVRLDVLISASGSAAMSNQFNRINALPLTYSDDRSGSFVIPLNGTLAQRALEFFSSTKRESMIDIFTKLATSIASRVNRKTIVQRTPEARLAARLFDFDQIVQNFLGDSAQQFYDAVQAEWKWNSRYWEQVALLNLNRYQALGTEHTEARHFLELSIAHARHAVSIEHHPLTLTTLAKILLNDSYVINGESDSSLSEAINILINAISIEQRRDRVSVQPFMVMFRGVQNLSVGTQLRDVDAASIRAHLAFAKHRFSGDLEMRSAIAAAEARLSA